MSDYVGFVPAENGVGAWMLSSPHGAPVYLTPKGRPLGTWMVGAEGQLVLTPNPMDEVLRRIREDPDYLRPTGYVIDCDD